MIMTYLIFFASIVPNLKIIPNKKFETTIEYETKNPVQNAIGKFKNHPSIKMRISKISTNKIFPFCPFPHNEILKQTKNLDTEKTIQQNDIPTKL